MLCCLGLVSLYTGGGRGIGGCPSQITGNKNTNITNPAQHPRHISYHISVLQAHLHSLLTALDGSPLCCKCMQCGVGELGFLFCAACVEFIRRPT